MAPKFRERHTNGTGEPASSVLTDRAGIAASEEVSCI
jgi:hypothetical protein